ncbi:YkgJ family cysteine cluster protein [Inmirania thermothiophila]|uniref:Uncharacterized protein n=1 Tax=Inmirania thermothiophila TaxID=1750597 RepID=A0A3N1Y7N8_9GAMM|nr:YkgJ family cysteine cluster protein [Inmirania thermothiophila]ROR34531.1 hypothetical protein EDC57_0429 [Inmirania thermothiophila]
MSDIRRTGAIDNPVVPVQLRGDSRLQFRCRQGIDCWNACCSNIDFALTPYDILRMARRLGLTTGEFLATFTFPYEMDADGLPGVKLRTRDDRPACLFMADEGCTIYEDRPTACRYYPLALLSMRKAGEARDEAHYALVREAHCHGHQEPRELAIDAYRAEQGLEPYDRLARGWRRLLLKKRSAGPALGRPPKRTYDFFFMVCYDLDRFRAFVASEGFRRTYDLDPVFLQRLAREDETLLEFGYRLLRQVLFGEATIPLTAEAKARREARAQREAAPAGDAAG